MENNLKNENIIRTGYPHIDKPWMQYYEKSDYGYPEIPKMNLNKYIKYKTKDIKPSTIAQAYYGNDISYAEFFQKTDEVAKVFSQLRVGFKDRIMYFLPSVPETGQMWLGASQIGATSDFVDPRPDGVDLQANAKKILDTIIEEKAQYIVALDMVYLMLLKPIENELKDYGIEHVIVVSASDAMNLGGKIDYLRDSLEYYRLANQRKIENYVINNLIKIENPSLEIMDTLKKLHSEVLYSNGVINLVNECKDKRVNKEELIRGIKDLQKEQLGATKFFINKVKEMQKESKVLDDAIKSSPLRVDKYKNLVKECQNSKFEVIDDIDSINYIGHTSGTSSKPKPIPLTTKNLIFAVEDLFANGLAYYEGQKVLQFFSAYAPIGAVDSILLNFASGATSDIIPEISFEDFWYIVDKRKSNVLLCPPSLLSNIFHDKHMTYKDLSYVERAVYGGGGMKKKDEQYCNELLFKNGSKAKIQVGHGQSEYCGCGCYGKYDYKRYESIGIPLPYTTYSLVDPYIEDKLVPLKFKDGEEFLEGELVVSNGAVSSGVLDDRVIFKHYEMDGKDYIRTNDIVKMDRNGIWYHVSRKDNVFTRYDGYKINSYELEETIEKHEAVNSCTISSYYDKDKKGLMPIAHIILTEECYDNEILLDIVKDLVYNYIMTNKNLNSREIPAKFKFRKMVPVTKNGKGDYRALSAEALDGTEFTVIIKETSSRVNSIEIKMPEENMVRRLK